MNAAGQFVMARSTSNRGFDVILTNTCSKNLWRNVISICAAWYSGANANVSVRKCFLRMRSGSSRGKRRLSGQPLLHTQLPGHVRRMDVRCWRTGRCDRLDCEPRWKWTNSFGTCDVIIVLLPVEKLLVMCTLANKLFVYLLRWKRHRDRMLFLNGEESNMTSPFTLRPSTSAEWRVCAETGTGEAIYCQFNIFFNLPKFISTLMGN